MLYILQDELLLETLAPFPLNVAVNFLLVIAYIVLSLSNVILELILYSDDVALAFELNPIIL